MWSSAWTEPTRTEPIRALGRKENPNGRAWMDAALLVILRSLPRRERLNRAPHVLQLGFGRRRPGHGRIARSWKRKEKVLAMKMADGGIPWQPIFWGAILIERAPTAYPEPGFSVGNNHSNDQICQKIAKNVISEKPNWNVWWKDLLKDHFIGKILFERSFYRGKIIWNDRVMILYVPGHFSVVWRIIWDWKTWLRQFLP